MTTLFSENPIAPLPKVPLTVLLIDDDPAMRTILRFSLKSLGYVVLVAGDGEEALTITNDHPEIRLIVLDVVMSGLTGTKLGEQLKTRLPDALILYCSGHSAAAMSRYDVDVRFEHFLQKPCTPLQLEHKLKEMLITS